MFPNYLKIQHTYSEESEGGSTVCAPIPCKSQCLIPISPESLDARYEILLEQYKKLHSEYSFTYRSEIMIRRILDFSHISREFKHFPLLKLLIEITCEMMFSEIELAAFCVYLNRFVWAESPKTLVIKLYIVALAVKNYFNSDLSTVTTYIASKIPNFPTVFNSWVSRNENLAWISPVELSKVFSMLVQLPFLDAHLEYNFYVDALLEMAPASVYEKPIWQEGLVLHTTELEECRELPVLVNLDSVFVNIGDFKDLPSLSHNYSIASAQGFDLAWPEKLE